MSMDLTHTGISRHQPYNATTRWQSTVEGVLKPTSVHMRPKATQLPSNVLSSTINSSTTCQQNQYK